MREPFKVEDDVLIIIYPFLISNSKSQGVLILPNKPVSKIFEKAKGVAQKTGEFSQKAVEKTGKALEDASKKNWTKWV